MFLHMCALIALPTLLMAKGPNHPNGTSSCAFCRGDVRLPLTNITILNSLSDCLSANSTTHHGRQCQLGA